MDEFGAIVLGCSEASSPTDLMGRIRAVIMLHIHRVLVDREVLLAA